MRRFAPAQEWAGAHRVHLFSWSSGTPERARAIEFDRVRQSRAGRYGRQPVRQAGSERRQVSHYLDARVGIEPGHLEHLFSRTWHRPRLLVPRADRDRARAELAGIGDRPVPLGRVLEVGEVGEHLRRRPRDLDRVAEPDHEGPPSIPFARRRRAAAPGSWAARMARPGYRCASSRTMADVVRSAAFSPTPGM